MLCMWQSQALDLGTQEVTEHERARHADEARRRNQAIQPTATTCNQRQAKDAD